MTIFWGVLAVASLVVVLRLGWRLPGLLIPGAALLAAVLAFLELPWWAQLGVVVAGTVASLMLRELTTPPPYIQHNEFVRSKMEESGFAPSAFASAFDPGEEDHGEVLVKTWFSPTSTDVTYRDRLWRAKLVRGAVAKPGRYKVLGIRGGRLILDEIKR